MKEKGVSSTSLHGGLKTRSPPVDDKSRDLPRRPSVDDGAVRKEPSVEPPTIGPRTA